MTAVRCADGRLLDVRPVPVLDRTGEPYEATLDLLLDGAAFGQVGERCAGALQVLASRLQEDPVPLGTSERGVRAWAHRCGEDPDGVWRSLRPHLPRDAEVLSLRSRDPDDVSCPGELRVVLSPVHRWDGGWCSSVEAVVQAWGDGGTGVRAVLDLGGLGRFVDGLVAECAAVLVRDTG